ncbi:N-methylhydantoinase A [Rhodoligotrophos appendicifer]|uniref:hydantoinase/oxoprolinase family protein n=1 Tax=Rhodoligotrophos appendicifer TaxID=987056 RepID=UPI0011848F73|nr:hydantoinase/oxoprolinase family protein [Rhodoligotrophos appendicifer]
MNYEIGVDIGGTFTDIVCRSSDGTNHSAKVMSSRADPSLAVADAITLLRKELDIDPSDISQFLHGTTVATNAILERSGARLGVLSTSGFEDTLEIGRQWRLSRDILYASILTPQTPIFLATGEYRRGIRERISASGEVLTPLDEDQLRIELRDLVARGVQAVAVCYLFSFRNPVHELRTKEIIEAEFPELKLSVSHEVDPIFREYERTVVTSFDAYMKSVVDTYLSRVENQIRDNGLHCELKIMQSRGGLASSRVARHRPVRLFLSGPAAGVAGASSIGAASGVRNIITVDIGGTSCDIALIRDGEPEIKQESLIDGFTVRVPSVDVNAIGAGGGSIAWLDQAGGLHVGPQSAGADPGPACYGKGGQLPAVTDASIVLGFLDPAYFAGGTIPLQPELSEKAIREHVAKPLGLSLEEAALGIHRVLNAQMAEGIKLVSVKRGYDVRDFSLMPFGGGGAVHATALASELHIGSVVVPRRPGVLAAQGLLTANMQQETAATVSERLSALSDEQFQEILAAIDKTGAEQLRRETDGRAITSTTFCFDMCFEGQSYYVEVRIPGGPGKDIDRSVLRNRFLEEHTRIYGYAARHEVKLINIRCIHESPSSEIDADDVYMPNGKDPVKSERQVRFIGHGERLPTLIYDRLALPVGFTFKGPAIVEQPDTTTIVEPGWKGRVNTEGLLILERI